MLVTLVKQNDRIVPRGDDSFALFNSLDVGQEISFKYEVKKQRSYQYLKFYFAMIKVVFENQSHYKTKENLHEAVKVRSGHYQTIIPFKGEPFIVAKSIAFDKMSKEQFEDFMKEAKTVCVELVGDDALEQILRFL